MKISEAIAHLEKLNDWHGDIELLHYCDDCCNSFAVDDTVLVVDDEDGINEN